MRFGGNKPDSPDVLFREAKMLKLYILIALAAAALFVLAMWDLLESPGPSPNAPVNRVDQSHRQAP